MKNKKIYQTPLLIEGDKTINDSEQKSNIFNTFFAAKSTVLNLEDAPPYLDPIPGMETLDTINTSPIEVSK